MTRDQALASLPSVYRLALQLRALGAEDRLIADCLHVPIPSVGPLVEIGERKFQQLIDSTSQGHGQDLRISGDY